MCRKTQHIDT
jgi:hypothetical protein